MAGRVVVGGSAGGPAAWFFGARSEAAADAGPGFPFWEPSGEGGGAAWRQVEALPAAPDTVALYLTDLAEAAKTSTIARRLAAIAQAHRAAGFPSDDPSVKAVWAGIRRVHGTAPDGAAPLTVGLLRRVVEALPDGLAGLRDRALLLVGFAGALRRSELVALDVEDLEQRGEGLVVRIRRSKTDPEGAGRLVGIPYGSNPATCPVRAVRAWLDATGITSGPLLRPVNRHGTVGAGRLTAASANRAVQRAVRRAGLDPTPYSAHSLRAGLATSAAEAASPNGPSWPRPATAPLRSPGATSAQGLCSGTTPRLRSGSKPRHEKSLGTVTMSQRLTRGRHRCDHGGAADASRRRRAYDPEQSQNQMPGVPMAGLPAAACFLPHRCHRLSLSRP